MKTDLAFENRIRNIDHLLLHSAETGYYIEKPKTQMVSEKIRRYREFKCYFWPNNPIQEQLRGNIRYRMKNRSEQ